LASKLNVTSAGQHQARPCNDCESKVDSLSMSRSIHEASPWLMTVPFSATVAGEPTIREEKRFG
jgi:hypothetical protein